MILIISAIYVLNHGIVFSSQYETNQINM